MNEICIIIDDINHNALGELPVGLLIHGARFNGVRALSRVCNATLAYDNINFGFFFEIRLGECEMDASSYKGWDGKE